MIDDLKKVGLSTYQARVLENLLQRKHTVKELIKSSKVPAGKVYTVLKGLVEKGLVKESDTRPKEVYVESASLIMKKLIDRHQAEQDSAVLALQRFATERDALESRKTPFLDIATGTDFEESDRVQLRAVSEAEKEVLIIMNIHHQPSFNRTGKIAWERAVESAANRGVAFKCIYARKTQLSSAIKRLMKSKQESFQVKRLDLNFARCEISDGKKALVKLNYEDPRTFGGMIFLENKAFAENLRAVFFRFWDEAE